MHYLIKYYSKDTYFLILIFMETNIILCFLLLVNIWIIFYKNGKISFLKKELEKSNWKFDQENKYFLSRLDEKDKIILKKCDEIENLHWQIIEGEKILEIVKKEIIKNDENFLKKLKEKDTIINRYKQTLFRRNRRIEKLELKTK